MQCFSHLLTSPHLPSDRLLLLLAGEYCWYVLEIHVKKPPPIARLQLSCPVLQGQLVSIPLRNRLDSDVSLEIGYDSPLLHGPEFFLLESRGSGALEVCFAPLAPGEYFSTIVITHPQVGFCVLLGPAEALDLQPETFSRTVCEVC